MMQHVWIKIAVNENIMKIVPPTVSSLGSFKYIPAISKVEFLLNVIIEYLSLNRTKIAIMNF